jgi:hypothetical protein
MAVIAGIGAAVAAAIAIWVTRRHEIYDWFAGLPAKLGSATWWKDMGLAIVRGIGDGMLAGIGYLLGPLGKIGSLIIDHFKGHSPPPLGPLHQLNRVNLVRTIADTMTPAPMLSAIRRVALVTALAAPMMVGAGAPALAAGAGGAGIVVNYSPNVTVKGGGDAAATRRAVMDALEADREWPLKVIERATAKRSRTEF